MSAGSPTSPPGSLPRAQHACVFCKRQKRKCDKLTPRCTTCRRVQRDCEYARDRQDELEGLKARINHLERVLQTRAITSMPSPLDPASDETRDVSEAVEDRRSPALFPAATPSSFPSAFFLDVPMFRRMGIPLPQSSAMPSDSLLMELGSSGTIRDIVDAHFTTTHRWLPIVWRRKIDRQASGQDMRLQSGTIVLLASMKLVAGVPDPGQHPAHGTLYITVKREISMLENQGCITVGLLQAAILVATYELGHGIYPAAYLSIGHCINVAHMMGLHDRKRAPQAVARSGSWSEPEELTRIWCAILVLDRYVHLGSHHRPLKSGDFAEDEILPCDTSSWDRGEPSVSIPLFVTSTTRIAVDPFARTCQVAHLLGRVISHREDKELVGAYRFASAKQLLATLDSLLGLLAGEFDSDPIMCGSAYAMALSGKMIFLDIYACTDTNGRVNCAEETEMQAIALEAYRHLVYEAQRLAVRLLLAAPPETGDTGANLAAARLSPFVGDCLYQGAQAAVWYLNETGSEQMKDARGAFLEALTRASERWKVAEEYMKMVEVAERNW